MWIRARFSGISKKHRDNRLSRFALLLGVVFCLSNGCVVTDKIDFEDAVNQPFAIFSYTPKDSFFSELDSVETIPFSATVWDPDVSDPLNPEMRALVTYRLDYQSSSRTLFCQAPSRDTNHGYDVEGDVYTIECEIDLSSEVLVDGNLIVVDMLISDLGFVQGGNNAPRKGAYVHDLSWVINIVEEK